MTSLLFTCKVTSSLPLRLHERDRLISTPTTTMADGPHTPDELDHDPINKTLNSLTEVEDQMDADQLDQSHSHRRREEGPDDDDRRYSEDDHDRARDLSRGSGGGDTKYYRDVSMERDRSQERRPRSHSPHTPPLPGSTLSNDPSAAYDRRDSVTGRGRSRSPVERRDRDRSRSRSPRPRDRDRDRERDKEGDRERRSSRSRSRPRIFVPRYVPGVSAGAPPGAGRSSPRDCRVYVGNLPYEVRWHQLKDFMREAGDVVFADILVQQNGMSKGCGSSLIFHLFNTSVVEYRTPEDAQRAIRKLNDTTFMGRPVFIREDREPEAKFGGVAAAARPTAGRQVYVGNLPYAVGWQELKDMFRSAAHSHISTVISPPRLGRQGGCSSRLHPSLEGIRDRAVRNFAGGYERDLYVIWLRVRMMMMSCGRDRFARLGLLVGWLVGMLWLVVGNWYTTSSGRGGALTVTLEAMVVGVVDRCMLAKMSASTFGRFPPPFLLLSSAAMYDGYEWNGRRIEVREDRFAGTAGGPSGPPRHSFGGGRGGWSSGRGGGPGPGGFGGHSSFGGPAHGGAGQFGGSGSGASGGYYRHGGGGGRVGGVGGGGYGGAGIGGAGGAGAPFGYGSVGRLGGEVAGRAVDVDEDVGVDPDSYNHDGGDALYGGVGRSGMMDYSGGAAGGYNTGGYGSGQYGQQVAGYDATPTASGYGYSGPMVQAGGASGEVAGSQIFVNNLPFTTTWQDLIDLFRSCGNIIRAEILEQNGRPKGSGVVRFDTFDGAERAVSEYRTGLAVGGVVYSVRLLRNSMGIFMVGVTLMCTLIVMRRKRALLLSSSPLIPLSTDKTNIMPQPPPMKFLDSMVRPNGLRVRPTFTTASPPPASAQLNNSASDRSMDATNDDTACSAPTTRKSLRLNKKRQRGGGQYDPEDADKRSSDGDANRTKRNYNRDSEGGDATAPFAQYAYKDPTSCSPGSGFEMDDRSQTETAGGVTEELYSLGSDETQSEGPEVGGPEVKKGGTVGGLMNEDENMYGQGRGEEGSEAGGLDEVISEVASLVEEYHA
ncbi:hypothetical protein BC938DRAFT_481731 [Jimgerdemannia flammicorona]|uniref:RRM domain-containing protein n=1 Tax=Jimgerdemannia flammicorona TaxID=994334 RepID=A0A433QWN9_9FUNG|nr:hypothetical protein BC938DRAFT_481731 [Jimgerdemannia flammicorona]